VAPANPFPRGSGTSAALADPQLYIFLAPGKNSHAMRDCAKIVAEILPRTQLIVRSKNKTFQTLQQLEVKIGTKVASPSHLPWKNHLKMNFIIKKERCYIDIFTNGNSV
jgi:hypothetical protein